MPTLDVKKLQENITKSVQKVLLAQTQAVNEGMLELEANLKERIFYNGQDNAGGKIGGYSTKPMYASVNGTSQVRSSSLKARGKNATKGQRNQDTFANGKKRKSMYLPGGYSEYRKVVGRQNSTVDLNLTGSLQKDIRMNPQDGQASIVFTTDEKALIAEGNEKRFGKTIFAASEQEISKLVDGWEDAVTKAFYASFE